MAIEINGRSSAAPVIAKGYFVRKSLAASKLPAEILSRLIPDFDGISRKEKDFRCLLTLVEQIDEFKSSSSNGLVLLS